MPLLPLPDRAAWPPLRDDDLRILPAGALIFRVYKAGGRHPAQWSDFRRSGPIPAMRWDHHVPPPATGNDRSSWYGADHPDAALGESSSATRVIDRVTDTAYLAVVAISRALRLLSTDTGWPTRAGATLAINAAPFDETQRWARAIYETYLDIEGIWYPSRISHGHHCVALFERSSDALPPRAEDNRPLQDPLLDGDLRRAAARFDYRVR